MLIFKPLKMSNQNSLVLIIMILISMNLVGQEKITEFDTRKAVYDYPEMQPMSASQYVNWKVYKDSLVMTYTGKRQIRRLKKEGLPTQVIFKYPMDKNTNEYAFQKGDIRIRIILSDKRNVVTKEKRDDFSNTMKKEIYF